ncbi:MAG: YfdQ family protein [Gammaproteobacteria bacterium]|nr:YfdQ family protein [Gammaproteobacteria bacterium]
MADLSAQTIDRILQLGEAARKIDWDKVAAGGIDGVIIDGGAKLVDLEKFFPGRRRFRGVFNTRSLASFMIYLNEAGSGDLCFIDQDQMAAHVVIDMGNTEAPGHCDHNAWLELTKSVEYEAVLAVNGKLMSQIDTSNWLEDWAACITVPESSAKAAAKAFRTIDLKAKVEQESKVGNFAESQSRLQSIEASSAHKLPEEVHFRVAAPYAEFDERTIVLQPSILTSGDRPMVRFRIVGLELLKQALADEFAARLRDALPESIEPLLGKFDAKS